MSACTHDGKFDGVFGVKNGCLACELEETQCKLHKVQSSYQMAEAQLVWLSSWARRILDINTNSLIGKDGNYTVAEVVANAVEERLALRKGVLLSAGSRLLSTVLSAEELGNTQVNDQITLSNRLVVISRITTLPGDFFEVEFYPFAG